MRSRNCSKPARRSTAALRKLFPALAAFSLLSWGASAQAQMQPVTAAQLGEAVGACVLATQGGTDMGEALAESGWETSTVSSDEGPVDMAGLTIRGRSDNSAVIMTNEADDETGGGCVVTARLASTDMYHPTAEAISRNLGAPVSREDNTYYWMVEGRAAQLAPTGSRDEPSLRFFIMQSKDSE